MAEPLQSNPDGGTPQLADLGGVSNVLLQSASIGPGKTDVCHRLLGQTDPAETNVLAITFTKTPAEWVEEWTVHAGDPPSRGGIVSVGQATGEAVDADAWTVERVENASDLTGLGIALSNMLSNMATAADHDDEALAVCFDSITSLLQYADLQGTFQFLHVVTGRVKGADGVGHFHIDPAAHDSQDLATLTGLFDAVVEVDDDGAIAVRR